MIDVSSSLSAPAPVAVPPVLTADGGAASGADFAQTLGVFLDAGDAARLPQPPTIAPPARQSDATSGNALPLAQDDDADPGDTRVSSPWFAVPTMPVALPAVATVAARPESSPAIAAAASGSQVAPDGVLQPATPETDTSPDLAPPTGHETGNARPPIAGSRALDASLTDAAQAGLVATTVDPASSASQPKGTMASAKPTLPIVSPKNDDAVPAAQRDTAPQPIVVGALPQPAGQVFAAARALAGSWRDRAAAREDRDSIAPQSALSGALPIELRDRPVVQAATQSGQAALDLTSDPGLQRMIDRIELLRDAADATDTRVRLMPDALGSIDVAVRQDGDRVHVHFTAEQDATRALIATAQPRLTELAAARGLNIGDTTVSTGTGGGNAQSQPQPQAQGAERGAPPRAAATESAIQSPQADRLA